MRQIKVGMGVDESRYHGGPGAVAELSILGPADALRRINRHDMAGRPIDEQRAGAVARPLAVGDAGGSDEQTP